MPFCHHKEHLEHYVQSCHESTTIKSVWQWCDLAIWLRNGPVCVLYSLHIFSFWDRSMQPPIMGAFEGNLMQGKHQSWPHSRAGQNELVDIAPQWRQHAIRQIIHGSSYIPLPIWDTYTDIFNHLLNWQGKCTVIMCLWTVMQIMIHQDTQSDQFLWFSPDVGDCNSRPINTTDSSPLPFV